MERAAEPTASVGLHVCDGVRERLFYFVSGGVRTLSRGEGVHEGLVSHLTTKCFLDAETLQELFEEAESRQTSLREIIEEKGILSREELGEIVNKIVRDEILGLVFWGDSYAIVCDEPPKEIYSSQREVLAGKFEGREFSREIVEWVQLWSRSKPVLASDASTVVATEAASSGRDGLEPFVAECLDWCADEIDIRTLWQDSGHDLPALCTALVELVEKGLVRVRPPSPSTGDLRKALDKRIQKIEQQVEGFLRPALARQKLVECYRSAGQNHNVVHQLNLLAEANLQEGATAAALECFREILELQKENVEAHERVVRILVENDQEKKAVAHATSAAREFLANDACEEARFLARLLGSTPGGQVEGRKIEAEACVASGQTEQAVDRYVALAEDLVSTGDEQHGLEIFEAALRLDPQHPQALTRARALKMAGFELDPRLLDPSECAAQRHDGTPSSTQSDGRRWPWRAIAAAAGVLIVLLLTVGFVLGLYDLSEQRTATAVQTPRDNPSVEVVKETRIRHLIDKSTIAEWGPSQSFELIARWSGERLASYPTRENAIWAVGFRAKRVGLWEPGQPPVIYSPPDEKPRTLSWSLPDDTAAVAVGHDALALRRGQHTFVYPFDGKGQAVGGGGVGIWTRGVFVDDLLIVQGVPEADGAAFEIWGVRRRDMKILWTARSEFGALVFR
jgi:tetratricopeptide (TPR) repeat protein